MRALVQLFSLRYLARHKLRACLGLLAIALGVALFVSSSVTTSGVQVAMQETVRTLAGQAEWQVTRGSGLGVEEDRVETIRQIPGAIAAPVIQASALVRQPAAGNLLILGVDFWNDSLLRLYKFEKFGGSVDFRAFVATAFVPNGIILTRTFAEKHGLSPGATLTLDTRQGIQTLQVTGLLEDEGPARVFGGAFAIMELHAAQRLFGRSGFVDRIEVAHATRDQVQRACPGCDVAPTLRRSSMLQDALARIQSLAAVSVIALLVGLFIIYNSVQISIVERLKEIGTLRALGATRRQMLLTLLLEWLTVGLLGSVAGIAGGYMLSRGLLGYTARTVNAMIPLIDLRQVHLTPFAAGVGLALGLGATLAATFFPAQAAIRRAPLDLLHPYGYRLVHRYRAGFGLGALVCLAGIGTAGLIPLSPPAGLAATGLVFLGLALLLPYVVLRSARWARLALERLFRLEGYLAADNLGQFPQRTALTAITLGGALAMMVATATIVEGFRAATAHWIAEALPFDLAIMPIDFSASLYGEQTIPRALVTEIRQIPGVDLAYGVRQVFASYRGADIMVFGVETRPYLAMHRRRGLSGWARPLDEPENRRRLASGEGVFVSENFAALFGVRPGEVIDLPTPSGPRRFQVLEACEDYSWPHGVVAMDLDALGNLWKDDAVTYIDLSVRHGASPEQVRAQVAERLKDRYTLFVYDKEQIRRASEGILEQTISVANVQVLIAVLIGFLGIVNSLLIGVLQRTREIGLLRAVGMTRRQVARTVVLEGLFIALVGGAIGLAGGIIGGWLPLRLFTFAITGYLYPLIVPWRQLLLSLAVAIGVGFVASLLPAQRAARLNVLEAIGYE